MTKRTRKSVASPARESVPLPISAQSFDLLSLLAGLGIYGRTPAEVAVRFIDQALAKFTAKPVFRDKRLPR